MFYGKSLGKHFNLPPLKGFCFMSRGSTAIMEPRVMGRPRKKPTRPIRVYEEVAVLIHKLAKIFDQDAPEFASDILLPILEKKQQEAASILLGKPKQK